MINSIFILLITILTVTGCNAKQTHNFTDNESVLDFYRQYSAFTDPGEYAYMFKDLPDSLPALCELIQTQFIHQVTAMRQFRDQIPKERWHESIKYPTVKSVLQGLIERDSSGLVMDRKFEDRLVLGCRDYALFLASIQKSRGTPVRLRYGHAQYLIPDFHTSHVVCEVWNTENKRWMLVDPSLGMIDFNREKFDMSNDAWLQLQNKEIDADRFGVPGRYSGIGSIVAKVIGDLSSVLGSEYTIYQYAPILEGAFRNRGQLTFTGEQIDLLNKVSTLMKSLNAENLSNLEEIYLKHPEIQITKSFNPYGKQTGGKTGKNPPVKNQSGKNNPATMNSKKTIGATVNRILNGDMIQPVVSTIRRLKGQGTDL